MWFMHDADLGCAFLFLDILAEFMLLSMTVMVIPCLRYVVGIKLVMSYVTFPQAAFACAPLGECRTEFANTVSTVLCGDSSCQDHGKGRLSSRGEPL